jgi:hypothetical protein
LCTRWQRRVRVLPSARPKGVGACHGRLRLRVAPLPASPTLQLARSHLPRGQSAIPADSRREGACINAKLLGTWAPHHRRARRPLGPKRRSRPLDGRQHGATPPTLPRSPGSCRRAPQTLHWQELQDGAERRQPPHGASTMTSGTRPPASPVRRETLRLKAAVRHAFNEHNNFSNTTAAPSARSSATGV